MSMLLGCAQVGPKSISVSRLAYAEAIDQTNNEQLLLTVVKGRYGETASQLAVNAIAANIRFRGEAGLEAGFGPDNFRGENLLTGGFAYEENPTITYTPVQGHKYIRQLESPVPLDLLMLTVRSATFADRILIMLVSRANNLRNPDFLFDSSPRPNQDFKRFVDLFAQLLNADILELVKNPNEDIVADVLISGYAPDFSTPVHELMNLLGLPMPVDETQDIVIPAYLGVNAGKSWGLGMTTRSTFDVFEILRASVEVPEEHLNAGLSVSYPPMGLAGQGIKIKSSKSRPATNSLAVPFRGYWFFIEDTDQETKAFFSALRTLWSLCIDSAVSNSGVPLMTIPVNQ